MEQVFGLIPADAASKAISRVLDPTQRISAWPLIAASVIAGLVFWGHVGTRRANPRRFARYLFPASIWRHRSTGIDVQVAIFTAFSSPIRKFIMGLTVAGSSALVAHGLSLAWGEPARSMGSGTLAILLLAVIIFLLTDLSTYVIHNLSHRWPVLWAFHRVHHSAEVLNPLTVARNHPVYPIVSKLLDVVIIAPFQGLAMYFWPEQTAIAVALMVRWGYGLFAVAGANLRHSHVWLSFGWLERIVVSPAQHQIHHSKAEEHWDRNFGEVLAIWDWMFGTLIMASRKRQKLHFGLANEGQPHASLWKALSEPFVFAGHVVSESRFCQRVRTCAARVTERGVPAVGPNSVEEVPRIVGG